MEMGVQLLRWHEKCRNYPWHRALTHWPWAERREKMDYNGPTLGDLIHVFYEELVAEYKDEELASVIAAVLINEMILTGNHPDREIAAA
jgi:hypothetical protein